MFEDYNLPIHLRAKIDAYVYFTREDEDDLVRQGNRLVSAPRSPETTIEDLLVDCKSAVMAGAQSIINEVHQWSDPILAELRAEHEDYKDIDEKCYHVADPDAATSDDPKERIREQARIDAAIALRAKNEAQRAVDNSERRRLKKTIARIETVVELCEKEIITAYWRRVNLIDTGVEPVAKVDRNAELHVMTTRAQVLSSSSQAILGNYPSNKDQGGTSAALPAPAPSASVPSDGSQSAAAETPDQENDLYVITPIDHKRGGSHGAFNIAI